MGQEKFTVPVKHDVTEVFMAEVQPLLDQMFELADQHNIPLMVMATLSRSIAEEDGGFNEEASNMLRSSCAGMHSHGLMIAAGLVQGFSGDSSIAADRMAAHVALDHAMQSSEQVVKETLAQTFEMVITT